MPTSTKRSNDRRQVVRISSLQDEDTEDAYENWTAEERLSVMWQLAQDCWSILDPDFYAKSRIQRNVVVVERRRC
jgi:hypothetical protein